MVIDTEPFYFIDTHAHLDMLKQMTPEFAVNESLREGVKYIVNVGSSFQGSIESSGFALKFENVFAAAGIHPHHAAESCNRDILKLEELILANKKIIAVGETGFDYFRNLSPKQEQKKVFIKHIELALKYCLPLIIHDRDAHDDMLDVLKEYCSEKNFKAVIHCFSGDTSFAIKCLEMGLLYLIYRCYNFSECKKPYQDSREVPLERMFLETDTPFLAPQEKRGKENFPGFVKYIAQKIAEIKETTIENVAAVTSAAAIDFFKLK